MKKAHFSSTFQNCFKRKKKAFSLLELSIVLLIISILVSGGITVSAVAINNARNQATNDKIEAIYKAMGRFLAQNHRLPCPASLAKGKSDASFGAEEGEGNCLLSGSGIYSAKSNSSIIYGMVPINALGLPNDMAEDGFGSKFSYAVNAHLTVADYGKTLSSNSQDDENLQLAFLENDQLAFNIDVVSDIDSAGFEIEPSGFGLYKEKAEDMIRVYQHPSSNVINNVAFVILSHGANKSGAYDANSKSQHSISGADNHEVINSARHLVDKIAPAIGAAKFGANHRFPGQVTFSASNLKSDVFDDVLIFKTRRDMVADFNLSFLLPCTQETANASEGFPNAFSGQVVYKNSSCTSNASIIPSKECGPFASTWIDHVTCPSST